MMELTIVSEGRACIPVSLTKTWDGLEIRRKKKIVLACMGSLEPSAIRFMHSQMYAVKCLSISSIQVQCLTLIEAFSTIVSIYGFFGKRAPISYTWSFCSQSFCKAFGKDKRPLKPVTVRSPSITEFTDLYYLTNCRNFQLYVIYLLIYVHCILYSLCKVCNYNNTTTIILP